MISLSRDARYADIWNATNMWFHYGKAEPPKAPAGAAFVDAHAAYKYGDNGSYYPISQAVPEWIAITVKPGEASVLLQGEAAPITGQFPWMTAGAPLYLYVFASARFDGGPGSMALDSITVVK